MNYTDIFLLAVALSVDACIVSFSYGLCITTKKRLSSFLLAITTGIFQAVMPILGYLFADVIKTFIEPYSKWIVFLIFMYLGVTFIIESMKNEPAKKLCVTVPALFLVGVATSIDAFSAGITLLLTGSPLLSSVLLIGLITFIDSLIGFWSAYGLKLFNKRLFEIAGGVILIFLAVKSLL